MDRLSLPRWARELSSWLLLVGGISLPITLALEGLVPPLIHLHGSAIPAMAFCAGAFLAGAGALRTEFSEEVSHAGHGGRGTKSARDRAKALQEGSRA